VPQLLARALVFFTSAAVLVIEILAVRLLAPYLGVSLEVFTGIIGVILAGISLGAWLGGRSADRVEPRRLLGPLLVAGGLSALASPLIVDVVGPALSTDPASIVVAATLGFLAPAAVLTAVTPVVVKIQLRSLAETGSIVGSYSAIGTAGAIFGTFVTGFVLIAAFPTRPIVVALGVSLTVFGLALWVGAGRWLTTASAVTLLGLAAMLLVSEGPCHYETAYHCAIIETDDTRPSGRVLFLDRLPNSYVDLEDPTYLEFRYIQLLADIIEVEAPDEALRVVSIGGGGFTLPGYLEATRPDSQNIVLEIDGALVDIGRQRLALTEDIEVVVDDARISLRDVPTDSVDVVIGDAFSGASVPWHLTTREFVEDIRGVLTATGIYTMNVIDYGRLDFARSAAATLTEVFDHVALFAPPSYLSRQTGGNFVLVASVSPLDVTGVETAVRSRGSNESGIEGAELERFIGDATLLTDDYAPVDQIVGKP
jgi:spermidine synthase